MAFSTAPALYPLPSEAALKLQFVGKQLQDIPAPAAIIDAAVVRRNCKYMLDAVDALGLKFRAHVKTHKTTQLAKLQVGEDSADVRLIVSTVAELENLTPWLLECRGQGKSVSVLYGVPIAPSHIPRLAAVSRLLGPESVGLFVDHPEQLQTLVQVEQSTWPDKIPVFVKVDAGYHRAGVLPDSIVLEKISGILASQSRVKLIGAYAHMGHSYSSNSPEEALDFLRLEIEGAMAAAKRLVKALPSTGENITISVGATPTATSTQNLLGDTQHSVELRSFLEKVKQSFDLEIHAGVYPVLDMQQLATRARRTSPDTQSRLSFDNLGLRVMVEVASTYEEREKPEALICAGSIALGREPCKSYSGWGVVSPWKSVGGRSQASVYDPENTKNGWIVGRISQEHGILTWEGDAKQVRRLAIGEKVMIWPNHACMAGPSFGWYLIVDSDQEDADVVRDVWIRGRGW